MHHTMSHKTHARLLEVNPAGTVPVAKDLETNEWIVDSGVIAEYLEKKFPEHPLGTTSDVYVGVCLEGGLGGWWWVVNSSAWL